MNSAILRMRITALPSIGFFNGSCQTGRPGKRGWSVCWHEVTAQPAATDQIYSAPLGEEAKRQRQTSDRELAQGCATPASGPVVEHIAPHAATLNANAKSPEVAIPQYRLGAVGARRKGLYSALRNLPPHRPPPNPVRWAAARLGIT